MIQSGQREQMIQLKDSKQVLEIPKGKLFRKGQNISEVAFLKQYDFTLVKKISNKHAAK